ncbi:MAG TPA: phosphate-starvation-inducible PsiE family protein [Methanocorpusculum sp.]|nr:phosphate-starvation-inducible PsiE family protein [Methanocorpusculum sp.]HJJ51151.1 phosphate-starvation-inducible PsiE family protein [Methanocorpusculum sp.]
MADMDMFPRTQKILVKGCSLVTIGIYVIIAALLVITALIGTIETLKMISIALENPTQTALTGVLQGILLIIVIATLIDMVQSYVRAGRVLVRPILIAGVTTMVRRLLVTDLTFIDIIGTTLVILGLTVAMIYLGREDRDVATFLTSKDES